MLRAKVAVITGATCGIGAATAVEFAKQRAQLVLHGRNEDGLKKTKESCLAHGLETKDVVIATGDITEEATVDVIIKTTMDTFGRVDIIFHNAGGVLDAYSDGPINTTGDVIALDYQYKLSVRTPYVLTQKLIPELVKSKGTVIFDSSMYSMIVAPVATGYCIMKAAQDQMVKTLALSLAGDGIRVNSVNPGCVATKLRSRHTGQEADDQFNSSWEKFTPLENKIPTSEEIAKTVVFLASDQSSCMTGVNIVCDRGYTLSHPYLHVQAPEADTLTSDTQL